MAVESSYFRYKRPAAPLDSRGTPPAMRSTSAMRACRSCPTVATPEDEGLQDSTSIIEAVERPRSIPKTPING